MLIRESDVEVTLPPPEKRYAALSWAISGSGCAVHALGEGETAGEVALLPFGRDECRYLHTTAC